MPTYRRDEHLGHEVPLIGSDDISNKSITLNKLSDDLQEKLENSDVYRFFNGFSNVTDVLHMATVKPEAVFFHTGLKIFVALKDGKYYCQWDGSDAYNADKNKHLFLYEGKQYSWNGEELIESSGGLDPETKEKIERHEEKIKFIEDNTTQNSRDIEKLEQQAISPDEEDITSVDKVIKFADKDYIPAVYSGLGRVYLRKNIVSGELTEVLNEDGITFEDGVWGKQVSISTVFGTAAVSASLSVNGEEVKDGYVISLTKYKDGSTVKSVGVGIFGREITADDKDTALRGWFNTSYIPFVTADDYDTIILRVEKNGGQMSESDIVYFSIKTKGIGGNILTQDMINKPNTIYHIQYDYDLNGAEITILEGCVLEFDGGSLRNGTLKLNNTFVNSNEKCFTNISFYNNPSITESSTIYSNTVKLSWFCNEGEDCADVISIITNLNQIHTVILDLHDIKISHPIIITNRNVSISGFDLHPKTTWDEQLLLGTTISPTDDYNKGDYTYNACFALTANSNVSKISNLKIKGNYKIEFGILSMVVSPNVNSITIEECWLCGLAILGSAENTYIEKSRFYHCGCGIYINAAGINENNIFSSINNGNNSRATIKSSGAANWITIRDCDIASNNVGICGGVGSNTNIITTGINHCSTYAIYFQYGILINIDKLYTEGCGKTQFWISENSIETVEGNNTMCQHIVEAHYGEPLETGNDSYESGWGVYGTLGIGRVRPAIYMRASYINIKDSVFAFNNIVRNKYGDASFDENTTKIGVDCVLYASNAIGLFIQGNSYPNIRPYYGVVNYNFSSATIDYVSIDKSWVNNFHFYGICETFYGLSPFKTFGENAKKPIFVAYNNADNNNTASSVFNINALCEFDSFYNNVPLFKIPNVGDTLKRIYFKIPKDVITTSIVITTFIKSTIEVKPEIYIPFTIAKKGGNISSNIVTPFSAIIPYHQIAEYFLKEENENIDYFYVYYLVKTSREEAFSMSVPYIFNVGDDQDFGVSIDGYNKAFQPFEIDSKTVIKNPLQYEAFFNTSFNKTVLWNSAKWVDSKGMTAGVHKGNTEYRGGMPIGTLTEADWYGALDSTPEFNGFKNGVAQTQGDGAGTGTPRAIYFDRIRGKFLFESEDPNISGNYLYWEKWVGSTYTPFVNPTHGTIYKENDNYWKYIAPKTNATLKLDPATDIGYEYFDTDLGKMVYAKSIATDGTASWVDANGVSC